jgi:hypothetical protein
MCERGSLALVKQATLVAGACLLVSIVLYGKDFSLPKAENANSYPAHDSHPTESVAIAAVPYTGQNGSILKGDYAAHGILPVYVVFSNDGGSAVELSNMQVQLVTVDRRAKIEPSTDEDIYRKMSRVEHRGDEPSRNPLPIPLPRGGPKVGVKKEVVKEIDAAQFRARAVEAHSTRAGFMFFDVSGIRDPLEGGKLYVTGVRDAGGKELMYFEVALDKAVAK